MKKLIAVTLIGIVIFFVASSFSKKAQKVSDLNNTQVYSALDMLADNK